MIKTFNDTIEQLKGASVLQSDDLYDLYHIDTCLYFLSGAIKKPSREKKFSNRFPIAEAVSKRSDRALYQISRHFLGCLLR